MIESVHREEMARLQRVQVDCYLAEVGVEPPQTYGWRMEDVIARVARESAPEEAR